VTSVDFFPIRGRGAWRVLIVTLVAALAFATLAFVPGSAALADDPAPPSDSPAANPGWPSSCGVDVALVFDTSNSINGSEGAEMVDAAQAFAAALAGTPSRVAATFFRGIDGSGGSGVGGAVPNLGAYRSVETAPDVAAVTGWLQDFDDATSWGSYGDLGGTNWQKGFDTVDSLGTPDLLMFLTDGNPTTHDGSSDLGGTTHADDVQWGVVEANFHKNRGSRVVAVGIGSSPTVANLTAVSSPDAVFTSATFDDLEDVLQDIARQLCVTSLTVTKWVDGSIASGWEFTATDQGTQTTGGDGTTTFTWDVAPGGSTTVTVTEVLQAGFDFSSAACALDGDPIGTPGSLQVSGIEMGFRDQVTCDFFNVTTPAPALDVEKATNGVDADSPTGPVVAVGDAVTWTYVVTNTGNVTVNTIAVTDSDLGAVSCPETSLVAGAAMTCTANGTATAGQYANTGTVTGDPASGGDAVGDSDDSHYFGVDSDIDIEKATNGTDADTPTGPFVPVGDPVTWTYVVTNTGNSTLTGIGVTDSDLGAVSCPETSLAAGAAMTCTANGTATAGQYANTGTVTATDPASGTPTDSDDSHYFGVDSGIDIEKATNGTDADTPTGPFVPVGDPVTWTYVVTNTGNSTLVEVGVADNILGTVSCPGDTLVPGATMTCTANGTATAGQYANTGTVSALDSNQGLVGDSDNSHYFGTAPALDVEKATNGVDADSPTGPVVAVGDAVTWTYVVTNTGNVTVNTIAVTDSDLGAVSCPETSLVAGAAMTCTANGTATAGQYANTGTVTGDPASGGDAVGDSDDSHYFGVDSDIDIEKATNGTDADTPTGPFVPVGDPVTWTYVVTNTGNSTLTGIGVTDSDLGAVSCPETSLAAGAAMTCTANGTATAGQYANTGTVTATDPASGTPTDSDDSHYFGVDSGIDIEKTPDLQVVDEGSSVTFTITVKNTGNVRLTNVEVTDPLAPSCNIVITMLDPGQSEDYECALDDVIDDFENVATVTGETPDGDELTDADNAFVEVVHPDPAIQIDKDPDLRIIPAGVPTDVTWDITVTNTGEAVLFDVTVTDPAAPACALDGDGVADLLGAAVATMEPGASFTYECTLPDLTLAEDAGPFVNTATAAGVDRHGTEVTDSDDAQVVPLAVAASAMVGDFVWNDLDGDGVQDEGEPGIKGAVVRLTNVDTATVTTKTTNADGLYLFAALEEGNYTAALDMSSVSGTLTTPGSFTFFLAEAGIKLDVDFGVQDELPVTGIDSGQLAFLAGVLLAAGALLLLVTRRREDGEGNETH